MSKVTKNMDAYIKNFIERNVELRQSETHSWSISINSITDEYAQNEDITPMVVQNKPIGFWEIVTGKFISESFADVIAWAKKQQK